MLTIYIYICIFQELTNAVFTSIPLVLFPTSFYPALDLLAAVTTTHAHVNTHENTREDEKEYEHVSYLLNLISKCLRSRDKTHLIWAVKVM